MTLSRSRSLIGSAAGLRRLQTVAVAFVLSFAVAAPGAYAQGKEQSQAKKPQHSNVLPITITGVVVQGTQLVANALVGTQQVQIPLTLTPQANPNNPACPILDLAIGEIHLTLLGLNVDTSPICLEITAQPGPGQLLGNLLCNIANLLNGGLDIGSIVNALPQEDQATFTGALTQVLNGAFSQITSSTAVTNASCNILNLSIGPLELNLLGLVVELDDCNNGPVTVDITATPGGGLLGDLLCDLGNLLNPPGKPNQRAVLGALREIIRLIGGLVG